MVFLKWERLRDVVKVWFPTARACNGHIASGPNERYFLTRPCRVSQLLLQSLLFIKSRRLSHNFTRSPVEKLSVDFIASRFSHGPAHLLRARKPEVEAVKVIYSSVLMLWSVDVSAFDFAFQTSRTDERPGTAEGD